MKKIVVTEQIKSWASSYANRVQKELNPADALNALKNQLIGNEADYVQDVVDLLPKILELLPWDIVSFHNTHFAKYDMTTGTQPLDLGRMCSLKDYNDKVKTQQLYLHIVDALRYYSVQQDMFPEYVKKMGIHSCVYCNAQYAVSSNKGKTDKSKPYRTTYTLDHWKPKSKYPYLAVAFFNLYPCCASCNQTKSWYERDWMMYCQNATDANPFEFKLKDLSLLNYLTTWDVEKLMIDFQPRVKGQYIDYDEKFHITKLYNNFKSEVEDVIWRSRIYNIKMIEAMQQSGVYQIKPYDVKRFVIGNYDCEEDILKRPLAKLIQDVARQIGLI